MKRRILFFVFYGVVFSILLVIALYDYKHKIIPDELVYVFIFLSIVKLGIFFLCNHNISPGSLSMENVMNSLSPFVVAFPFYFLWVISNGKWLGFGDVKLAFGIGALLGFVSGVSAVVLAFWIGALVGIFLILRGKFSLDPAKKLEMGSEVPFAPFLILATFIVFFTRIDVLSIKTWLSLVN